MMTGSSTVSISEGSGQREGLSTSMHGAVGQGDLVADAGRGGDEVEVVLALEALLNDLEMQQTEEAAAEAEAERDGGFGFEGEGLASLRRSFSRASRSMACSCESTV